MLRSTFALAILLSFAPASAFAGATSCLTGTAPEVAGDDAEIRDARDTIDAACPCATYDGSDGFGRGDYLACVKTAMSGITTLRKQCTGAVKKIYKASRCGRSAVLAARPCIYESLSDGKVSCKIRYTNKKDGTPNDKCVSNTKYTATPCSSYDFCLDAADTNDDLLIAAPGDDGVCVVPAVNETFCQSLPSADCSSTAGAGGTVLVGDVLTPTTIYRGGQVVVDAVGVIVHVGCASTCTGPCADLADDATVVTCPDSSISAGLINAHDHITFSQNVPYNDTGERYEHRHDWRLGLNGHTEITTTGSATANEVRYGELRHLIAGTTSVIGSGGQTGLLRNLDSVNQEGLALTPTEVQTFPLGDSGGPQLASGCNYSMNMVEPADIAGVDAYLPHVAEGVSAFSRNEMTCLSQAPNDIVEAKTAITGGMALTIAQIMQNSSQGSKLVWSPRSNISLYGNTAQAQVMHRLGITVALGTDWMPTGSMNMLRELQCAASFDDDYLGDELSDLDLWLMATQNAADVAGFPTLGSLEVGNAADIAVYDASTDDGYAAVVNAGAEDVQLVMRSGKTLYGDATFADSLNPIPCEAVDVCGVFKSFCLADEIGLEYSQLLASVGPIYPLWFCGTPTDEPTCVPSRSVSVAGSSTYDGSPGVGDADADGVLDTGDNCLGLFNPILPVDGGIQSDADADGEGDPCDPCPLDADTTVCTFDPDDLDSDGVSNGVDNCPVTSNASQADIDADQHGDACDACPSLPNPGNAVCPELTEFAPTGMYMREGDTNEPTFPQALFVTMNAPVAVDTFVAIDSSNPSALSVVGGGVTVQATLTSAPVFLTATAPAASVTLTASFDSTSLPVDVRVLGIAEQPELISLTPAVAVISPGATQTLTATVDIPAPPGGTVISLSLTPSGAGTIPATVTVLEDQTEVEFDYVDNGSVVGSTITVEATLGADSFSSEITAIFPGGDGLVINEVDYDNVGTDTVEFIEIYNASASELSMTGLVLHLVNGSNNLSYESYDLSTAATSLLAGEYLVICPAAMSLPPGTPRIDIGDNTIQNGAPDGVAIVDLNSNTLVDAVSYEGAISMTTLPGVGTVTLLEGGTSCGATDSNVTNGSIARLPNGNDTDSSSSDWGLSSTPTPGTSNVP